MQARLDALDRALAALDDTALRHGLSGMGEKTRVELAASLSLPRPAMHLGDALVPLFRRKLTGAPADRQLTIAFGLSEGCNDDTVATLGDRSANPTREDMLDVLPDILERHGAPIVSLMLAAYAVSDADCRDVFNELLSSDERVAIGPPVEVVLETGVSVALGTLPPKAEGPEEDARREQRRIAKAARREAEGRERAARVTAQAKRREAIHKAKHKKSAR